MSTYLPEVKKQYEAYPYPPRDPEAERENLRIVYADKLDKISHFCFRGRLDWTKGMRVLVAGGGTGDSAIFLAEQLRDTPSEVVYLDFSQTSFDIARQRAAIRGLTNIQWVHDSLLNLPTLGLGKFDYINCSGVLHHLADPLAGLKALTQVLKPEGAMGMMVYAKYGRTDVYRLQPLLKLLNRDAKTPQEEVANARKLLAETPQTIARNHESYAREVDTDAGLYDLLLHSQDRPYTVPELYEWLDAAGISLISFTDCAVNGAHAYRPKTYIRNPELLQIIATLSKREQEALAEMISGKIRKHAFYAGFSEDRIASLDDPEMVPCFSMFLEEGIYAEVPNMLAKSGGKHVTITHPASIDGTILFHGRYTEAIFRHIDGKRALKEIFALASKETGADPKALLEDFHPVFNHLNLTDWMMLRHSSAPSCPTAQSLQRRMVR